MAKKKLRVEGKTRTLVIVAAGITVVGILVGIWSWNRSTNDSQVAAPPSKTVNARVPRGDAGTNSQTSKLYDKLVERRNEEAAAQAEATGGSAMPVIRTEVKKDPIATRPAESAGAPDHAEPRVDREAYRRALEERQKAIRERQQSMSSQLALLQKAWTVEGHVQLQAPREAQEATPSPAPMPAPDKAASGMPVNASSSAPVVARAGDTSVAVLVTPINTDDPMPMYKATIVADGPLRGATLLGTIASNTGAGQYGSGVTLTFQTITIPGQGTMPVSAFAINASDAGALQGKVNRHLWSRYAAAFGGAFLQGVGQGLLAGGREQSVITSANGYAVQSNAYTNKQLMMMGAANVGQVAANSMQSMVNRPPTIRIPGQTTIGVFFTADLAVATEQAQQ